MEETAFKIQANTQPAITSIGDLRKALKAVKDEMVGLEEGSEQWLKLANKAGEYKHTLDELNQSIKGASSDFGDMVGNISAVGAGLTGAFQSAKAALSMFGVESQEVMKSIQTMQNLMAMTQGLASIDAGIKAFKKLTATIKASATAMKILNTVMTPKVLLPVVAAIAAISAAAAVLTKRIKETREEAERAQRIEMSVIDVSNNAASSYAKQSSELTTLLAIAKDETQSMQVRQKACDKLNTNYKGLNASIDANTSALKYNESVANDLIATYQRMATGQAAMNYITDESTKLIKLKVQEMEAEEALEKAKKERDSFSYSDITYNEEQGLGEANQAIRLQRAVEKAEKKLENIRNDINESSDKITKVTKTFADEISSLFGDNKSGGGSGTAASMYTAINFTEQYLQLLLKLDDKTDNYSSTLVRLYDLKVAEYEVDKKKLDELNEKLKLEPKNVNYLKQRDEIEKKLIKTSGDMVDTNNRLFQSYISLFSNFDNLDKLEEQWNKYLNSFKTGATEEAAVIKMVTEKLEKYLGLRKNVKTRQMNGGDEPEPDDGEPRPNHSEPYIESFVEYEAQFEEAERNFAEFLGLTEEQLKKLYTIIIKKRQELRTLEKQASGEMHDTWSQNENDLANVNELMDKMVQMYGSAATCMEEYMRLQIQHDDLIKKQFSEEVKLANLRRQANDEVVNGSVADLEAQYADIANQMEKLVDEFGEDYKQTEEYMQLQIKLLQLHKQIVDLLTEEKLAKIELAQLDNDIAAAESYRLSGDVQALNERIRLEEEYLNVLALVKDESLENMLAYKQQLLQLKNTKKELEAVKWASVDVANNGLGYIADMLGSIGDLYDTNTKEGFEKQKKFTVAQTIMNGIAGTISAVTSWMNPANAWMTAPVQAIMAALQSAAIGVATAAQVAAIKRTTFDGGGSSSSVGNLTLVPPVEYTSLVQGANIEENTSNTKQYVAVTEINEVADRVDVAEQESRY